MKESLKNYRPQTLPSGPMAKQAAMRLELKKLVDLSCCHPGVFLITWSRSVVMMSIYNSTMLHYKVKKTSF